MSEFSVDLTHLKPGCAIPKTAMNTCAVARKEKTSRSTTRRSCHLPTSPTARETWNQLSNDEISTLTLIARKRKSSALREKRILLEW